MIKSWLLYLCALAAAVVFHTFYFGWFSWFLLVLAVLLPVFSFLVSLLAMLRVRLLLHAPAGCVRGASFYVTLRGANGFLPLPRCRFRLTVTSLMTGKSQVFHQNIPGRNSWYVAVNTDHCGVLRCAAERGRVYDYLGLFFLPIRLPEPVEVCVEPIPTAPDPLPSMSQSLLLRKRPKPGGGFSEEHEMRDYRPGDSLRDIHWKLSVKTDRTIVREAQETIRGQVLVTFDLTGDPDQADSVLEQLVWVSNWLLEQQIPHQAVWLEPAEQLTATADLASEEDLRLLLARLLRTRLDSELPSLADRSFPNASWHCHILPQQEDAV